MKKNHQKTVAYILEQLAKTAFLLKIDGANVFKVKAYEKAIDLIGEMGEDFYPYLEQKNYTDIKGIGAGLSKDIEELSLGQASEVLNSLLNIYPESLLELKTVKGLGGKKIATLFHELNVTSLADLEYACYENRLLKLDGFGDKTQEKIIKQLAFLKSNRGLFTLNILLNKTEKIEHFLMQQANVNQYAMTGDVRRCLETAACLEYVVASDKKAFFKTLQTQAEFSKVDIQADLITCEFEDIPLHFYPCTEDMFSTTLFQTTGSTAYLEEAFAEFNVKKPYANEEDIFKSYGQSYRIAELREASLCYSLSIQPTQPNTVLEKNMIQGVFHMHSTYSDGKNTLEEMVLRSIDLGYQYMGISEHSETAFYAKGLNVDRMAAQAQEISELRKKYPQMIILHGIESDILPDGRLDYPDKILAKLDFVIASVHASMNQSREAMTERCLKALENPYCTILGHPTGRVLLGRESFHLDLDKIFQRAGQLGKMIEINANPKRLDIDWRHLPLAKKHKVKFMINPDAHSVDGLEHIRFGVNVAKKGGLSHADVVNTLSFKDLKPYLHLGSLKHEQ